MKLNLFFILFLLIVFQTSYSQTESIGEGSLITLTKPLTVDNSVMTLKQGGSTTSPLNFIESGYKYEVVEILDDDVLLRPINFEVVEPSKRKAGVTYKSDTYNDRIFKVSKTEFFAAAEKIEEKDRVSLGVLTLPFKARPQDDFSFDTEFNLSTTLNVRFCSLGKAGWYFQGGAGIGSVNLNSTNSSI
ncbi:MAG: hypothetical protein WBG71_10465 [Leeuwenhoekiella sp.]